MARKIEGENGIICAMPREFLGYFGWPSVARLDDGTLVAVASGLRATHVCPFGRTIICTSRDDGRTWTSPRVVNDSPLDDRDAGAVCLGGRRLLITWFTTDDRKELANGELIKMLLGTLSPAEQKLWDAGVANITDENAPRFQGAWIRTSEDGGESWNLPVRVPLTSPHGPIRLRNGNLLYLGKEFMSRIQLDAGAIVAMTSADSGTTWQLLGQVPLMPGTVYDNFHEAHVVELPSGKLVGAIRLENAPGSDVTKAGYVDFSILVTESTDGGCTWSTPRALGFHGSPPHLIRHSSGALVMTYGFRQSPYGERVALSYDEGATWEHDVILRDDAPDWDLGYPASVELPDGSIFTVYYQKPERHEDKCGLLYTRWRLP